jgi:lipopolysaccharide export system permease protein
MKKIVYKKLARDCTSFFFLTLFTISVIIWVLQAVNYLDFVVEDGHGFCVYFNYTLLSFPKIFSRIYPFAIFLAFSYVLLKYEERNELVIFWNFGIKKIIFINFFIKLSFLFVILSLLLNAVIVPLTQDKARSFIRSSDLDFFESILKPKKFIDIIHNLTIYFDEKDKNKKLKNIFLNNKISEVDSQITVAKTGRLEMRGNKKILVLYDGKTINTVNGKTSEFKFSKTDFNISKFGTNTFTHQKTQETSTIDLLNCSLIINDLKKDINNQIISKIDNCELANMENVYEELYSRLIKPLYITFLIIFSLLFILKSKIDHTFNKSKIRIYTMGFLLIIFLESSSKFISTNMLHNLIISALPIIFILLLYFYFLRVLKVNKI